MEHLQTNLVHPLFRGILLRKLRSPTHRDSVRGLALAGAKAGYICDQKILVFVLAFVLRQNLIFYFLSLYSLFMQFSATAVREENGSD